MKILLLCIFLLTSVNLLAGREGDAADDPCDNSRPVNNIPKNTNAVGFDFESNSYIEDDECIEKEENRYQYEDDNLYKDHKFWNEPTDIDI